ncbi:RES family NAD+ phosphorylase [Thalassomonas sp. M1454]|uniref:RES family NAD+ phosphorylase n=1 Tax=Thalassomonas sp. M1454 TaxID=2594477 RepID=UPI00117EBC09|nr:RES family NAD+ phosphorylase [Thalassomonas sp. M1454]TRX53458.1 RES domain-containing protein [Thalassomonas sp. M1454]
MRLYRIVPREYADSFSGLGASYQDGARWNEPKLPVLYFALSPSVAMLEMANYFPSPRLVPKFYVLATYIIEDKYVTLELEHLPKDWSEYPYPRSTQKLGTDWLKSQKSLGLLVPSCAVPSGLENILVINPKHPDIKKLKLVSTTPEIYNNRAFNA